MVRSLQQPRYLQIKAPLSVCRSILVTTALVSLLSACQSTPPPVSGSVSSSVPSSVPDRTDASTGTITQPRTTQAPAPVEQRPVIQAPINQRTAERPAPTATNPLTQQTHIIEQPRDERYQPRGRFDEMPTQEPIIRSLPRDEAPISRLPSEPPTTPSHTALLERARQNSQQQSARASSDQSDLPAFRNLMQAGTSHLQSGNLNAAENSFTRAQRLTPRSSEPYFYLSQVALRKNQPRKAEAMARRGLTITQDASQRRALWQLILQSGQQQNNSRVIREAQQALR